MNYLPVKQLIDDPPTTSGLDYGFHVVPNRIHYVPILSIPNLSLFCIILQMNKKADEISKKLEAANWSMARLAKAVGQHRQTVAKWLSGYADPRDPDMWQKMLEAIPDLENSKSPLSQPMGIYSYGYRNIRYAGVVPCGDWGDPLDSEEMIPISAEFEHPKRFAATVAGDSCYPALLQGDLTIWHVDPAPTSGLIVLAQRKGDHGCTVKQLKIDDKGLPHLVPINPQYDEPENGDGWGVIAKLVVVIRQGERIKHHFIKPEGIRPDDLIL